MELHKNLTLDPTSNPAAQNALASNPMAIPLNQLVKPHHLALQAGAVTVPTSAALFDLNNYSSRSKPLTTKLRATMTSPAQPPHGIENGSKTKAERKFAPY